MEVAYEAGAVPFTGVSQRGVDFWNFLRDNIQELYRVRNSSVQLVIPNTTSLMTALPDQAKSSWSVDEIFELANQNRKGVSTGQKAFFYILFLNGNYRDSSGNVNTSTIGINIGGTSIIAIFKDVITNPVYLPRVQIFMEQATLIHEMGHALGLVNNGIPLATDHQDVNNGAHTINSNCVMYYLNEGPQDLRAFVQKYVTNCDTTTGSACSLSMWGAEVLQDIASFRP